MKTLYFGGAVLPMDCPGKAQALAVEDGKILAVGALEEVEPLAQGARRVDLEGRALLPAFVDGHSHITALAQTLGLCQLSGCGSLEEMGRRMKAFRERWAIPAGEWVIGFGYDPNDLREGRHPTKGELDAALPDCPAMVTHASGHMGVVNSLGLQRLGVTAGTPDPEGGRIGRLEDGSPSGYPGGGRLYHHGLPHPPRPGSGAENLERAQQVYFSQGIATIHEGLARQPEWDLLASAAAKGLLRGDVAAYVDIQDSAALLEEHRDHLGQYRSRLKIAGYKLLLDGSPQGRTAWVEQPYRGGEPGYRGYPVHHRTGRCWPFRSRPSGRACRLPSTATGTRRRSSCCAAMSRPSPSTGRDIRPVMVHAQLLRPGPGAPPESPWGWWPPSSWPTCTTGGTCTWPTSQGRSGPRKSAPLARPWTAAWPFDLPPGFPGHPTQHGGKPVVRRTPAGPNPARCWGKTNACPVWEALRAVTSNAAYALFEEGQKAPSPPASGRTWCCWTGTPSPARRRN